MKQMQETLRQSSEGDGFGAGIPPQPSLKMYGLPAYFENVVEPHYIIEQCIGNTPVPDDPEMIGRVRRQCGACFGAHMADFYETQVYPGVACVGIMESQHLKSTFPEAITFSEGADMFLCENNVAGRKFEDGVRALLQDLCNFAEVKTAYATYVKDESMSARLYFEKEEYTEDEIQQIIEDDVRGVHPVQFLGELLRKECGAPDNCFGTTNWPDDIKPSQVLTKLVELYPPEKLAVEKMKEMAHAA